MTLEGCFISDLPHKRLKGLEVSKLPIKNNRSQTLTPVPVQFCVSQENGEIKAALGTGGNHDQVKSPRGHGVLSVPAARKGILSMQLFGTEARSAEGKMLNQQCSLLW